jgi:hypothetical protein
MLKTSLEKELLVAGLKLPPRLYSKFSYSLLLTTSGARKKY